jgi:hypothetical protein
MNIYRTRFSRRCPVTDAMIFYEIKLWSSKTVMAGDIQAALDGLPATALHEEIADLLELALPGRQAIEAAHELILVRTERGEP